MLRQSECGRQAALSEPKRHYPNPFHPQTHTSPPSRLYLACQDHWLRPWTWEYHLLRCVLQERGIFRGRVAGHCISRWQKGRLALLILILSCFYLFTHLFLNCIFNRSKLSSGLVLLGNVWLQLLAVVEVGFKINKIKTTFWRISCWYIFSNPFGGKTRLYQAIH